MYQLQAGNRQQHQINSQSNVELKNIDNLDVEKIDDLKLKEIHNNRKKIDAQVAMHLLITLMS